MHQPAECGMQEFQSIFPHVKDHVSFEDRGQRKLMMKLLLLLYNMRTKRVGINQILFFTHYLCIKMSMNFMLIQLA